VKLFGLIWAGAATWFGYARYREHTKERRRWREALLELPLYRISEVPDGTAVRVRGGLRPVAGEDALVAPLSGRPCVAWHIRVEQRRRDLSPEPHWRDVGEKRRSGPAVLDDGSAQAVFDPVTEWDLRFDARGGSGLWHLPESSAMRTLLEELGVSTQRPGWQNDLRIHEAICGVGEPIVAAGRGQWEIDTSQGATGYREVSRRPRLRSMSMGRLVVTDDRAVLRRSHP